MSKPSPPKLDCGGTSIRSILTDAHVAKIKNACGVRLTDRAARTDLELALNVYLRSAAAEADAPTLVAAKERLAKMGQLATELRNLTSAEADDATEQPLQSTLVEGINFHNDVASRLNIALGEFLNALASVEEIVPAWVDLSKPEACERLASDLDLIWRFRLGRQRAIWGGDGVASPFVKFAESATDCLPSNWPWRPAGRRQVHSLQSLAQALRRCLRKTKLQSTNRGPRPV